MVTQKNGGCECLRQERCSAYDVISAPSSGFRHLLLWPLTALPNSASLSRDTSHHADACADGLVSMSLGHSM